MGCSIASLVCDSSRTKTDIFHLKYRSFEKATKQPLVVQAKQELEEKKATAKQELVETSDVSATKA